MWPFTGKRLFSSRWWALGFVAYVCWLAVQFAAPTDASDTPMDAAQARNQAQALTNALDTL